MGRATALLAVVVLGGCWPAPAAGAQSGWRWPVGGELLSAYRYGSDPYAPGQHRGIDVAAAVGAPVVAATDGTVRFAGVAGSSGLTVSIRTADGRFDTSYLHLSSVAVRAGENAAAGATIGTVGTSGRRSTGAAHLHFGVRVAGTRRDYRDPLALLPPRRPVRDRPRGAPPPIATPVRVSPEPRPVAPRLEPAPEPVRSAARAPSFEPAPRPVAESARPPLGWAVACLALSIAAALVGGSRRAGRGSRRTGRSSIGARVVLRHHPDLLRQR
ncbi:MAG TPA: peptidoglycan DD-metalloendopeptidase family protein [Thermoleophilaceae bacterium]|nr:peptidoglycan DD-metalloendopeptidase family protein [Thermoleophilaceae bacterium]